MLARLLFGVASRAATGAVVVADSAGTARIDLQRGFVYALWESGAEPHPRGEEVLRRLLARRRGEARFEATEGLGLRGRVAPFHPAAVVRNHVEATLDAAAGPTLRRRAAEEALRLVAPPHASCLGFDERVVVSLLSSPRRLAELERVAPWPRLERLLVFLEAVGVLRIGASPYERLGLDEDAPLPEVRRAYKRLARELHPDLHPELDAAGRELLAARFTDVSAAYRVIVGAGSGGGDD